MKRSDGEDVMRRSDGGEVIKKKEHWRGHYEKL